MAFTRTRVETNMEQKIITGMIVNTNFAKKILPIIKEEHIDVGYANALISWIRKYINKFGESPQRNMKDLFITESQNIRDLSIVSQIESFLINLNQNYENESSTNWEYHFDQARNWLRKRSAEMAMVKVQSFLSMDKIDEAERAMREYKTVAQQTADYFDPFTNSIIKDEILFEDDEAPGLFKFPGDLGKVIGWFEQDWLVSFLAPMKRGKTFALIDCAVNAMLYGNDVAFFSFEMSKLKMTKRFEQRMQAVGKYRGKYKIPVFDCIKNQQGVCNKPQKVKSSPLYPPGLEKPDFDPDIDYSPCTACMHSKDKAERSDYEFTTWFYEEEKKSIKDAVRNSTKIFDEYWGKGRLKIKCFPRFGGSIYEIMNSLDEMEYLEGFVPKVVIVDYIDIIGREGLKAREERHQLDELWKTSAGIASERHQCWITASQSKTHTLNSRNVEAGDWAEDIRKAAHIDMSIGLHQTIEEKREGVMRLSTLMHRHDSGAENVEVYALQQLGIGQPFIDTYAPDLVVNRRDDDED